MSGIAALEKRNKRRNSEWYSIRSLLGIEWAIFYICLGSRECGKSYAVMEYFVKQWKKKKNTFYWLRLNEASSKKLLSNNAEKLVDPDLVRKYDLELTVKGNAVYDHGEKMCSVLALSTFYSDKGNGYYDKDWLKMNPGCQYLIALDEFSKEKNEKSQGDICYQFVNQLENLVRSTKDRVKVFCIANMLEEAADILTMFNFIPETFGRYYLKKKRCVIDYIPNTEKYIARRKGTIADLLTPEASTFTNEIKQDHTLITKQRLVKPMYIIKFDKDKSTWFTVWNDNIIAKYNGEKCTTYIAMRPYIDSLFDNQKRDQVFTIFDYRGYNFHNLITMKLFQKELKLIKPRKS